MSQVFCRPPNEFEVLFQEHLWLGSCSLYSLPNESVIEVIQPHYPMKDIDRLTYVVGSCNGLVCLACCDGGAFLWNPTTRNSIRLPEHNGVGGCF